MAKANRPYSAINVFDNLHKKIPKGESITGVVVTFKASLLDVRALGFLLRERSYNIQ